MLPLSIPALFITGTDTDVGKTVVAAAIADHLRRARRRVAVCKPVATGCPRVREGLVSPDAEFLAACAGARHPLDVICPQRYAEPLAPAVAAARANKPVDESTIDAAIAEMSAVSDIMILEGVGGLLVPITDNRTCLNWIQELAAPTVIVARPGLGTINHTLLTIESLRRAACPIAGVIINRYPPGTPDLATETNPRAIERAAKIPILCLVPDAPVLAPNIPAAIRTAIDQVDWFHLAIKKQ